MRAATLFALLLAVLMHTVAPAQSVAGLTKVRDTSYTTQREWEKLKKQYPDIRIATVAPSAAVTEKLGIVYATIGSRNLKLDAFLPAAKGVKKRTAFIFVHGGGWRSGDWQQHQALARRLAQLGYVCFTPEYRLSTEALFPAAVQDLHAAVRWVHRNAATYGVDEKNIVIGGFSAGGELAAFVGNTTGNPLYAKGAGPGAVSAVVNVDGTLSFVHPESGEGDDSKKLSAATLWFGFSKKDNPMLWSEASPLHHVSASTPPTLFLNSSVDRMHAGRDDYRKILAAYGIRSEVKTFAGAPHSFPLFHPWFDSVVQAIDVFLQELSKTKVSTTIIVSQDGKGDYTSVQAALDAVPRNNLQPVVIFIKKGVYREKLWLDSTQRFVTLLGEDKWETVLRYDDHTGKLAPGGDTINTYTSQSFLEAASDFTARNISFENNAGFSAGQAVAVQVQGDRSAFFNCRFLGNQDVLFTSRGGTRQYFEDCYIEGTTDFIFGASTTWFEHCHIHSKKNSHVTAASTPGGQAYGYVFNDCLLTGDTALHNVSLGRPWRPYAQVVYMNCYLGAHIRPEGWSAWNNNDNHLTTSFAEYNNYGAGAALEQRLPWTKKLTMAEAATYRLPAVLGDWNPLSK